MELEKRFLQRFCILMRVVFLVVSAVLVFSAWSRMKNDQISSLSTDFK